MIKNAPHEDTFSMIFDPPSLSIKSGRKARVMRYGPLMLTSQLFHQSVGSLSAIGRGSFKYAALLITTSILPKICRTCDSASATAFSSVMSTVNFRMFGLDFSPRRLSTADIMAASVSSRPLAERASKAMLYAAAFAKEMAMDLPTPCLAPVTNLALPDRSH